MRYNSLALLTAATAVAAQRPEDESICDYYTKALLKENTAENQATLLTLVVNTVVIGNCKIPYRSSIWIIMPSSVGIPLSSSNTNRFTCRHRAQCWHQGSRYPRRG